MKKFISLFVFVILSACTTMADLKKPTKDQYFTLEKDHVRTQVRGMADVKWVEGLTAGKYTSAGEDEDGIYFIGPGRSIIKLTNEDANYYLQTGKIPEAALKRKGVIESTVHVGGIWIPKKGVSAEPRLFYEIRNTTDGSHLGIVGYTGNALTEGALNYIPYGSEKEFVSSLSIVDN